MSGEPGCREVGSRVGLAFVLLTVTALAAPVPAGAATVSIVRQDDAGPGGDDQSSGAARIYTLSYAAAAGEANELTMSATPDAITVAEVTIGVSAGAGCEAVDARTVRCPTAAPGGDVTLNRRAEIGLGDGDDRFSLGSVVGRGAGDPSATIDVLGGPGDDGLSNAAGGQETASLAGGEGADVLTGGAGDDRLAGDAGPDRIAGGAGSDTIQGGADADTLDGGAGSDALDYGDHASSVVVDLASPQSGSAGEGDMVAGFEDATGGMGNDTLRGTSGPNDLRGGPGTDTVDGRAGDDTLDGERVTAGAGDDVLGGVTSAPDCGPGTDLLSGLFGVPGPGILLPAACERLSVDSSVDMTTHLRRTRGALSFTLFSNVSPARRVKVTVRDARTRKTLGRGSARLPGRRATTTLRIKPTRAGRRALRAGSRARLRITYRDPDSNGGATFGSR